MKKYMASESGKKAKRRYENSEKGKRTKWEYRNSLHGKRTIARAARKYWSSEKGKKLRRRADLKKAYGLAISDRNALLRKQGGVCAICGHVDKRRTRLSVDHNHSTGEIRGLLCIKCNVAVGFFDNSTAKAIKRLLRYVGCM